MSSFRDDEFVKTQKSRSLLLCIGTGLLYGTVSSTLTFSNKALAAAHNYNFPLFVLFLQVIQTYVRIEFLITFDINV